MSAAFLSPYRARSFARARIHGLVKPSVAINSAVARSVDAGHDIRNVGGSDVFVLSTATSAIPPVPVEESVARRNQFRAQIPYLRARRNRRFELIVDERSLAPRAFSPLVPPVLSFSLFLFWSQTPPFPAHPPLGDTSDTRLRVVLGVRVHRRLIRRCSPGNEFIPAVIVSPSGTDIFRATVEISGNLKAIACVDMPDS